MSETYWKPNAADNFEFTVPIDVVEGGTPKAGATVTVNAGQIPFVMPGYAPGHNSTPDYPRPNPPRPVDDDANESHDPNAELLTVLAHLARNADSLRRAIAVGFLPQGIDDNFGSPPKLIYAALIDSFERTHALPPKEVIILDCTQRMKDQIAFQGHMAERVFAGIERVYTGADVGWIFAKKLIADHFYRRDVSTELKILADLDSPALCEAALDKLQPKIAANKALRSGSDAGDLNACTAAAAVNNDKLLTPVEFIKTGWRELDDLLGGGLGLGETSGLAGPPAMGKTTWVVNLTLYTALLLSIPTLVLSLEMRASEWWRLTFGIAANIPRRLMRAMVLSQTEAVAFADAKSRIGKAPLIVVDKHQFPLRQHGRRDRDGTLIAGTNLVLPDVSAESLEAVIIQAVLKYGVKLVCIDYLAKVGPFDEEELRRMALLNMWVCALAQRLNIHIVVLAQLNKAAFGKTAKVKSGAKGARSKEERVITLEDVRGGMESTAEPDNVIAITRDDWNTAIPLIKSQARLTVLKARHGNGGEMGLLFDRPVGTFLKGDGTVPAWQYKVPPPSPPTTGI